MPTVNFKQLWKLYSVSCSLNCSLYTQSSFVAVFFVLWRSCPLLVFFNVSFPGMLPIGWIQRSVPRSAPVCLSRISKSVSRDRLLGLRNNSTGQGSISTGGRVTDMCLPHLQGTSVWEEVYRVDSAADADTQNSVWLTDSNMFKFGVFGCAHSF